MRFTQAHDVRDDAVVRRLIEENPWATMVSPGAPELVASHYPMLLDDTAAELAVVTHVGRPDERLHDLGNHEVLVIFAGPHGYVSPSWYAEGASRAPTWNFSVAHCYGVPEVLSPTENAEVLTRLVAHFERHVDAPMYLEQSTLDQLAGGTVGLRIRFTRYVCKVKMSQDKDPVSQGNVLTALRREGPYQHVALAADMERALAAPPGTDAPRPTRWP